MLYVTVDIDDRAQPSQVTVQVAVDVADIPGTTSSNLLRTQPQSFTFPISGGAAPAPAPGPGPSPVPPPTPGGGVQQFDANGNCLIDDAEFFDAIDAWVQGQIDNALFFDVLDAWIAQSNVCVGGSSLGLGSSVGPGTSGLQLRATPGALTIAARDGGVQRLTMRVYTAEGREVFSRGAMGRRLVWSYRDGQGRPLANGVYLVAVTVERADGTVHREIRKVVVMR